MGKSPIMVATDVASRGIGMITTLFSFPPLHTPSTLLLPLVSSPLSSSIPFICSHLRESEVVLCIEHPCALCIRNHVLGPSVSWFNHFGSLDEDLARPRRFAVSIISRICFSLCHSTHLVSRGESRLFLRFSAALRCRITLPRISSCNGPGSRSDLVRSHSAPIVT